jgi:hypothetical protein
VRSGPVEAVVVVPLEGGAFGPAVLDQVVDVGFPATWLEQEVVAGQARRQVARDLAVERGRLGLGQTAGVEGDAGAAAGGAADRRAGEAAAEGPEPGLGAGEDLLLCLADRDLDVVAVEDRRDRQPLPERNRAKRRRRRRGDRQQPAAPALEGQEDGEGAAAKGAEESSAPEAVCV